MSETSPDALTTTSTEGKRIKVFPAKPPQNGFWFVRRQWVQWGMLALYVAIPWIQINGHPFLQLDIAHRRFSVFGQLFFAHEVPNLVFVALMFLMFIALITTLFGRAWCGWSCPQTVFIERVYRKIEFWIDGDHLAQRKLNAAPMDINKFFKRSLKYGVFALVSILLGQIFLGYFVGPKEAFSYLTMSPAQHPSAFLSVMIMSAVVMFDFGWFREQFCLVACPYGRMQSVFMDQGSFFLAYDEKRKDCIDCGKCVAVCPTGIDVRQGLQFECIACTACADACDSVMTKINKPKGLIGYGNLLTLQGLKTKWFRARVWVYGILFILVTSGFVYRLQTRQIHQLEVIRAVDTPYQQVKDPDGKDFVINHFKIRFYNLDWNEAKVDYTVSESARAKGIEIIRAPNDQGLQIVASGGNTLSQFFLKVPKSEFVEGSAVTSITGVWDDGEVKQDAEVKLVGPWK